MFSTDEIFLKHILSAVAEPTGMGAISTCFLMEVTKLSYCLACHTG
jgi:hypothetical protein